MPEYLAPGVYIEEIEIGSKPVEGVSTSTTAFIGAAQKGPIGEPTLVTSWNQFESLFGGFISSPRIYLAYAVDAYFRNGGKRAYIVRAASATAAKASCTLQNRDAKNALVVEALEVGSDGNSILLATANSSKSGNVAVFKKKVDVTTPIAGREITVSNAGGFEAGDQVSIEDGVNRENAVIEKISGSTITVAGDLTKSYSGAITLRAADIAVGDKLIKVDKADDFFPGSIVQITDGAKHDYGIVEKVDGKKIKLAVGVTNKYDLQGAAEATVATMEFNISFTKGSLTESFSHLSIDPRHPLFFKKVLNSQLVTVKLFDPPATAGSAEKLLPQVLSGSSLADGGDDNLLLLSDYDFINGLTPLEKVEGISLLTIPGVTSQLVQQAMIDHCEKLRYRFAVLDSQDGAKVAGTGSVKEQRQNLGSKKGYAALYYPWVQIGDPVSKELICVPPSGSVAGIYARSDGERGVHKAPANEAVAGAVGLATAISKGEQEELNPLGVNVIRFFPGRGNLVWGARTIASGGTDPSWKYVNIRRLFIFLEESIERATQWVVFEPNNEKLWARVRATITEFLTRVWRDGALMGVKAEEAFFVKCDRTTMSQDDIDNGRLICVIGVAPVKPAEFVVFRIAQWAGGSSASE